MLAQIQAAKRAAAMELALGHLDDATTARGQANVQQAVDAAIEDWMRFGHSWTNPWSPRTSGKT